MRRVRRLYPHHHLGRSSHMRSFVETNRLLNNNCNQTTADGQIDDREYSPNTVMSGASRTESDHIFAFRSNTSDDGIGGSVSNSIANMLDGLEQFEEGDQDNSKYGRILRSIREVVSCCACYSSDTVMKECTNGHLICQNCFLTIRQDERPQCPTCRANLYSDSRRALIAQKVLSELPDMCADCRSPMLHKCLPSHRLNSCPKRRVACGLSALGCDWTGCADQYDRHYPECGLRKQLTEQQIGSNIDWLIARFKKREQTMRETFHCFSNVLRHLESHELQTVTITLTNISPSENTLHYRSDHFHVNQSRWTAEINMSLGSDELPAETPVTVEATTNPVAFEEQTPDVDNTQLLTERPLFPDNSGLVQPIGPQVMRRRRWNHGSHLRHHPYQIPPGVNASSDNNTEGSSTSNLVANESTAIPCTTPNPTSEPIGLGDISYRLMKENSPGIGRRAYAFVLLQIRVPDTGIQIYARPQLQTFRFSSRGDHTSTFPVHPIRWRYLSSIRELAKYRLIQAELVIARKIVDDHTES